MVIVAAVPVVLLAMLVMLRVVVAVVLNVSLFFLILVWVLLEESGNDVFWVAIPAAHRIIIKEEESGVIFRSITSLVAIAVAVAVSNNVDHTFGLRCGVPIAVAYSVVEVLYDVVT